MTQESLHWADQTARKVVQIKGEKDLYTCASGITPSGVVHIGNFREIITTDLVVRALQNQGKKVRFIYSWDDYDVFRKIPRDMPNQDMLKEQLRKPICDVPDPYGDHESYAKHHQMQVEEVVPKVGIKPEFIYQHKKYRAGDYAEQIKFVLKHKDQIREILDKFRKEPRPTDWLPLFVYNPDTQTDDVINPAWDGDDTITFTDSTGKAHSISINDGKYVSLPWRVDWPMRWKYEGVDFEPGGKDHSSAGGSYDTGKIISKEVFGFDAPLYIMYDFIRIKGGPGKMSSSAGGAVTLNDVLEIYEPAMARWLFAGTRPGSEFAISFDEDVIKIYEDFDKCERIYYGVEAGKTEKDTAQQKRIYELSAVDPQNIPQSMPFQPGFRHLTTLLQIYSHDSTKVVSWFENNENTLTDVDKKRIALRASLASTWLQKYAPETIVFTINEKFDKNLITEELKPAFAKLVELLQTEKDADTIGTEIWQFCKDNDLNIKEFFQANYQMLISKNRGPKLIPFIDEIGRKTIVEKLKQIS